MLTYGLKLGDTEKAAKMILFSFFKREKKRERTDTALKEFRVSATVFFSQTVTIRIAPSSRNGGPEV